MNQDSFNATVRFATSMLLMSDVLPFIPSAELVLGDIVADVTGIEVTWTVKANSTAQSREAAEMLDLALAPWAHEFVWHAMGKSEHFKDTAPEQSAKVLFRLNGVVCDVNDVALDPEIETLFRNASADDIDMLNESDDQLSESMRNDPELSV